MCCCECRTASSAATLRGASTALVRHGLLAVGRGNGGRTTQGAGTPIRNRWSHAPSPFEIAASKRLARIEDLLDNR